MPFDWAAFLKGAMFLGLPAGFMIEYLLNNLARRKVTHGRR